MQFNKHFDLEGQHAFLGASKYHWINYDLEKLKQIFISSQAQKRGIEDHDFARRCIERRQKLPRSKRTLNMFVNDAIGYRMTPELVLKYSENCFGTSDALGFEKNTLRIFDLKTGVTQASMHQLEIYAALFFLEYQREYDIKPTDTEMDLRIYQSDEILVYQPTADDILPIMDKIVTFDKYIRKWKEETR